MRQKPVVAVDGPSGVGKSTAAKGLAEKIGFSYVDTGALYRFAAWLADSFAVDWLDGKGVAELLALHEFAFGPFGLLLVDGRPIGDLIRTPHISRGASQVARHVEVREVLVEIPAKPRPGRRIRAGRQGHRHRCFSGCGGKILFDGECARSSRTQIYRAQIKGRTDFSRRSRTRTGAARRIGSNQGCFAFEKGERRCGNQNRWYCGQK